MTTTTIDTHEFYKELIVAGMPELQAEVVVRQHAKRHEDLATKQDLELLKQDLRLLKKDILLAIGGMIVGAVGIILAVLPLVLK